MRDQRHFDKSIVAVVTLAILAAIFAAIGPANAITRIETTKQSCASIHASLIREGAAILRHTSKKGLPLYDRYVRDSDMCSSNEIGVWKTVPALDTKSCKVIACDGNSIDDPDDFPFVRPHLRITQ